MVVQRNRFINDDDLSESTSLMHLLDRHDEEITEEANILKHSPFYSELKFINILKKVGLCVLDLNIQNIYSKFDEFELFVARANIHKCNMFE